MKLSKDQLRETYFDGTVVNFRGDYHARTMTAPGHRKTREDQNNWGEGSELRRPGIVKLRVG